MSVELQFIESSTFKIAKPFIKWPGGKQSLATTLINFFPQSFSKYYEPFVGGGSVFFALSPKSAVLSDENKWLIDTYLALKTNWEKVAGYLDKMINTNEEFLKIRAIDPWKLNLFERAAHFIYLNKTCFRGLFRVNSKGGFNAPYGAYNRRYYDPQNIEAVVSMLSDVQIKSGDFEFGIDGITPDDFVYFDPPYYPVNETSKFTAYTKDAFLEEAQEKLAEVFKKLDKRGCKVMLSNSDTKFIRDLYKDYKKYTAVVGAKRFINCVAEKRGEITEVVVRNYK